MDLFQTAKEKKVLLVAHRGTCGGNIPCNSMPAFKAALRAGADMIELDVERSKDGELFIQHPGVEHIHLRMRDSIKRYPASVIEHFKLSNTELLPTQYPIVRLEEALSFLKGKCYINIDKFWENPEPISKLVREMGMQDQVLVKTAYKPDVLDVLEQCAADIPYMVITGGGLKIHKEMMNRKLRYMGIESLFKTEDAAGVAPEFIEQVHEDGKLLWVNSIVYDYHAVLSAGHDDDISMAEDEEQGWGWLADKGFDMIQTDFIYQCRDFLEKTGRRN